MQKTISIFYATLLIFVLFVQSGIAASIEKQLGRYTYNIGEKKFTNAMEIHIKGEIEAGDYEKFVKLLKSFSDRKNWVLPTPSDNEFMVLKTDKYFLDGLYLAQLGIIFSVSFDSPGGDVIEAMKIGRLIERARLQTSIPDSKEKCFSACFFMLVAGVNRTSLGWPLKKNLGVHRPYFNPSYFADLSSKEAKKKHENLTEITKQYLRDMHVPEELIELTYRVSPEEIYVLNEQELESWVAEYHPFMEDWLEAKCRHIERAFPEEEKAYWDNNISKEYREALHKKIFGFYECKRKELMLEQMRFLKEM